MRHRIDSSPVVTAIAFLLLATLWGGSFVAIEVGLKYVPPLLFAGIRYAVAGAVVLGYATFVCDRWIPRSSREWAGTLVAAAFIIAAYHALLYVGELYVSGAVAAVITSLSPVMTAAFAAVVLADVRLGSLEVGGFLCGIAGVAIIADPSTGTLATAETLGVGLVFLGTAAFALGGVLLRPLRTDFSIIALQGWAMVLGAALLLAGGGLRGEAPASIVWNATSIGSLAYLTVCSGVIAFLIYFALLDSIGPTRLHLVGYAEPIAATGFSWLLLGRLIDGGTVVGFLAILVGFLALERHRFIRSFSPRRTHIE